MTRTHGMTNELIYGVWEAMLYRCNNPHSNRYQHYGGRGIRVCERWRSFINFYEDMGGGYRRGLTLDRIDNDGNYEPGNCQWVDVVTQNRHNRRSRIITAGGITDSVPTVAECFGVNPQTVHTRLGRGWSEEEAVFGRAV